MTINEAEQQAREAWQKIVNHELGAVAFWGQPAHDKETRKLIDDYSLKRNKVLQMRRKAESKDGMNNWTFAAFVIVMVFYIVYKSNFHN